MSYSPFNNRNVNMRNYGFDPNLREPSPPRGRTSGAAENREDFQFSSGNTNFDIFMREYNSGPSSGELPEMSDNEFNNDLPSGHVLNGAPADSNQARKYYETEQFRLRQPYPMSRVYNRGIQRAIPIDPGNRRNLPNAEVNEVINGMNINKTLKKHENRMKSSMRRLVNKKRANKERKKRHAAANTLKKTIKRYINRKQKTQRKNRKRPPQNSSNKISPNRKTKKLRGNKKSN